MKLVHFMLPIVLSGSALLGQGAPDINGLITAASRTVARSGGESLELRLVTGDAGADPGGLMRKAADVARWSFVYQSTTTTTTTTPVAETCHHHLRNHFLRHHHGVVAEYVKGLFNIPNYLPPEVPAVRTLETTWVAVPLETAIRSVEAQGYTQGFSSVEILRPDDVYRSDEAVYVFSFPLESQKVAVSCLTGAVTWSFGY